MKPEIKIYYQEGIKKYAIVFDEVDSRYHFVDQNGKEWNVMWRAYETIEDAVNDLELMKNKGMIFDYAFTE